MSLPPWQAKKIGGSDVAALAGVSRWKKPIDIWRRIVEGHETPDNPLMRMGRRLEPVIIEEYVHLTGASVLTQVVREMDRPHFRASLDGLATVYGEQRVLEVKTANFRMAKEWGEGKDEVPMEYLAQVNWYCAAAKVQRADIAALLGGADFRVYTVDGDAELQAMLFEVAEKFWRDYVLTKTPPPPDSSDSYAEFLAARYPRHAAPLLQATPTIEELAAKLHAWRRAAEADEAQAKETENTLKALIGEAEGVEGAFGRITWKANKDSRKTDWEAAFHDLAGSAIVTDIITKHTTTKPGARVFRVNFSKEQS